MRRLLTTAMAAYFLTATAFGAPYTVKEGDSLSKIANSKKVSVEDIVNEDPKITHENKHLIFPGQVIQIPESKTIKNPAPKKAPPRRPEPVWNYTANKDNLSTRVIDASKGDVPLIWYDTLGGDHPHHSKFANYKDQKGSTGKGKHDEFHYNGTGAVQVGKYNGLKVPSAARYSKVLPQTKRFAFALADYCRQQKIGDVWLEFNAGKGHTKSIKHTDHVKGLGIDVFLMDKDGERIVFNPKNKRSKTIFDQIIQFANRNAEEYGVRMTIGYKGCKYSTKGNNAHNNHPHISLNGTN
jgi:LysM repeat protein